MRSHLLQDEVGVVINDTGQPAQSALTFPSTPIALAASGLYILAACTDGVHIYDRTSSAWVQSLPYPSGVVPSPGQSITTAYNTKGSCVLFSGLHKVSIIMPASLRLPTPTDCNAYPRSAALAVCNSCVHCSITSLPCCAAELALSMPAACKVLWVSATVASISNSSLVVPV